MNQISTTSVKVSKSSLTQCSDPIEKLFNWNPEQPRPICEYINGDYSKPFNNVAPELRKVGSLGRVNCVNKNRKQVLVNRPTQVQKISHTTRKLTPKFGITDEVKLLACSKGKKLSLKEHVERVKFAENLPEIETSSVVKERKFNHENPFNLDFAALDEYQSERHNALNSQRQRRVQIVRRIMETKKLKTKGAEEILQEERNKKFKLPAFFDVAERETIMKKIDEDETDSSISSKNCKVISVVNKPKNRKIIKRHYQHKRDKLRQRLLAKKALNEATERKMQECKENEKENLILRLADENFPSTECNLDRNENDKQTQLYDSNWIKELISSCNVGDVPCGYSNGNDKRAVLRSFHDPFYSEPRGKDNLHIIEKPNKDNFLTKIQRLEKIVNDPKYTRRPPNDDKLLLFSNEEIKSEEESNKEPQSAIRKYIQQIDLSLKRRNCKSKVKKTQKQSTDMNEIKRRYQRMNFMGIPTTMRKNPIAGIVDEIAEKSVLTRKEKSTSKDKHLNAKITPEGIKLIPRIPSLEGEVSDDDNDIEDECMQSKVFPTFVNANPRGNNPEMLRIDKSLPWIQNEVNATRAKLQDDLKNCNAMFENDKDIDAHIWCDKKKIEDENQSEMKRSYHKIIAMKFHEANNFVNELKNDGSEIESKMQSQSSSTLSSTGTNFTNDSGSVIIVQNKKIPKSKLDTGKKFQNRSLVTTKLQPQLQAEPFYTDNLTVMRQLLNPPDRFHTYRTRSCANIRQRVKVKPADYEDEIIGYKSQFATDIDDSYIKEFYQERSHAEYHFKPKSEIEKLRKSFRQKIETFYMKEKRILDQIQEENDAKALNEIALAVDEYEKFLETLKESTHRNTMRKMQEVKFYYAATDKLQAEYNELQAQMEPQQMRIFYLANKFVQQVKWQNFQYLIMPTEWRELHDHLHRDGDGNLEDYRTSIENRDVKNLWDRTNVTVDTIIDYINNVHEPSKRENLKTFANVDEFMVSYKSIESKSFKALAKFTYAATILAKTQAELKLSEEESEKFIERYELSMRLLKNRWKVISERVEGLKNAVQILVDKPLREAFYSPIYNIATTVTDILYKKVSCKANCGIAEQFKTIEKFAAIERKVLNIFAEFDRIPKSLAEKIEKEVRAKRKREMRIAENAYKIEKNIENSMIQVQRLLTKPKKKEKRIGKLPRSTLPPKPKKTIKKPPQLTPLEEEYVKAFTEFTGENIDSAALKNMKEMIQKIKNDSIPVYVDQLLESMGCPIVKATPWDSERIIKEEEELMKYKDCLPEVRKQLQSWEALREKVKMENIQKTRYLYENLKK